jgi:hypothetical protein
MCQLVPLIRGHAASYGCLSSISMTGQGVEQDIAEAVALFRQGADLGRDAWFICNSGFHVLCLRLHYQFAQVYTIIRRDQTSVTVCA